MRETARAGRDQVEALTKQEWDARQRIEAQEGSMDKKLADEQAGSAENLVDEQKETEKLEKKLAAQKRILEEQVIRFVI